MLIFDTKTRKLEATQGFIATKDKSCFYDKEIYLGVFDSEDNYIEVSHQEKQDYELDLLIEQRKRERGVR